MDPKIYKLYDSLLLLGSLPTEDDTAIINLFSSLIDSDYALALSAWEFLLIKYENKLNTVTSALIINLYKLFKNKNLLKINKAVLETPVLLKALFLNSNAIYDKVVLDMPVFLIIQNKLDQAHEIFKQLSKNTYINYGNVMREIFEAYFNIIFSKSNDQKVIKINKKSAEFFMTYINKIKGGEKALLTQRINEII